MQFEWDARKAQANLAKHDVAFEDAILVWDDPLHVIVDDRVVDGEERFWAIGYVGAKRLPCCRARAPRPGQRREDQTDKRPKGDAT